MRHAIFAVVLALTIVGCGDTPTDAPGQSGAAGAPSQPQAGDWQTLLEGDWSLPGGTEEYVCVRHTIETDLYVTDFEAINPLGTHHTLLTMGPPDAPDGITPCTAFVNHTRSIFGSGVGTNPFSFPDGVAIKIPKGTQLLLNLHLFNTASDELGGKSGTRFRAIPEADVEFLAEGLIGGAFDLEILPKQDSIHVGGCVMSHDVTVFAVAPHMHQMGVHMKIVAETAAGGDVLLHDAPYSFEEQLYYAIDPIRLAEGDNIRIECTHRNPSDDIVRFGDSSLEEMCLAGVYRYPANNSSFACAAGAP